MLTLRARLWLLDQVGACTGVRNCCVLECLVCAMWSCWCACVCSFWVRWRVSKVELLRLRLRLLGQAGFGCGHCLVGTHALVWPAT